MIRLETGIEGQAEKLGFGEVERTRWNLRKRCGQHRTILHHVNGTALVMHRSFFPCCSPPRVATTQLQFHTARFLRAQKWT
jgi:hypothetical protein